MDGRTLSFSARHRDTRCLAILVETGTGDNRANNVVVLDCLIEWLQNKHAAAFTSTEPGSSAVKS
jgi:hypothetical protein